MFLNNHFSFMRENNVQLIESKKLKIVIIFVLLLLAQK